MKIRYFILPLLLIFVCNELVAQEKRGQQFKYKNKTYNVDSMRRRATVMPPPNPYKFPSLFLKGNYVEVGVHPAASFGSDLYTTAPIDYNPMWTFWEYAWGDMLVGFNCDIGKDGYKNGTPNYMGDFFVPGTPLEGWGVKWRAEGKDTLFLNYGAVADYIPELLNIQPTSFVDKSNDTVKKAIWTGIATAGNQKLWIQQTTKLGINDVYFTIEVLMRNIGTIKLENVRYCRDVDPDNEFRLTAFSGYEPVTQSDTSYCTYNYVTHQPAVNGNADTARVFAEGTKYRSPLILGTIDSRAKVTVGGAVNFGQYIFDPDSVLDKQNMPTYDKQQYGDYQIGLAFKFGDLEPGQCVSFYYYYNMDINKSVVPFEPIKPDFVYKNDVCANMLKFKDITTGTESDNIVSRAWDFNNDGVFETVGDSVTYLFRETGDYKVKLKVEMCDGSFKTTEKTIHFVKQPSISTTVTSIDVSCNNANDGKIVINASGGSGLWYKISGSDYISDNSFANLTAGDYTITLKDDQNCEYPFSEIYTIKNPPVLKFELLNPNATDCVDEGSKGFISVEASGGTGTLQYSLDNLNYQNSKLFNGLTPNNYSIFVKDENNCLITKDVTVNYFTKPQLKFDITKTEFCFAEKYQLQAEMKAGSGTNLSILWTGDVSMLDNVNTLNPIFTANQSGSRLLICTLSDENGCSVSSKKAIEIYSEIVVNQIQKTDITCHDFNDGKIWIDVANPTGISYNFNENGYVSDNSLTNLIAGTYSLSVMNQHNCEYQLPQQMIINPPQLKIDNIQTNSSLCHETELSGEINILATGGTGALQYSIDNFRFQNSNIIASLPPDNYNIYVKDANNCSVAGQATVSYFIAPSLRFFKNDFQICFNSRMELRTDLFLGSGKNVTIHWTGDLAFLDLKNQFSPTFSGTVTGNYQINCHITDNNGCKSSDVATIQVFPKTDIDFVKTENITCNNANDGSLIISDVDSKFKYSVNGNNYVGNKTLTNLAGGVYWVSYKDVNNCTVSEAYKVNNPQAVTISEISNNNMSCQTGNGFGSLTVLANGGTGSLLYSIDNMNFKSDSTFNSLSLGNYTVYVKDANNCKTSGNGEVNYFLNPKIVFDSKELKVCQYVKIPIKSTFTAYNNAKIETGLWTGNTEALSGTTDLQPTFVGIEAGIYNLQFTVFDNHACNSTENLKVEVLKAPHIRPESKDNLCFGDAKAFINLHVVDKTDLITWQDRQQTERIDNLKAGRYSVTLTNINNCSLDTTFTIQDPPKLSMQLFPIEGKCVTENDGRLEYKIDGGTKPYNLSVQSVHNKPTNDLNALFADTYSVNLTDKNNCKISDSVKVIVNNCKSDIFVPNIFTPNGDGSNDVFKVEFKGITLYNIKIFNRWGKLLYESNNISDAWDGTYKGDKVADGVYFYKIQASGEDGKIYSLNGFLHLMR